MLGRILPVVAALALAAPAAALGGTVHVYFLQGEHGVAVHRTAPALTPARGAVAALLAGPTRAERVRGIVSAVPAGTRLRGLAVRGGVAIVDLSGRFASGGGTTSMQARLGQLVYTLTAVPGVRGVELRLDGRRVSVLGGEGLILRQPLTRAAYRDAMTP